MLFFEQGLYSQLSWRKWRAIRFLLVVYVLLLHHFDPKIPFSCVFNHERHLFHADSARGHKQKREALNFFSTFAQTGEQTGETWVQRYDTQNKPDLQ